MSASQGNYKSMSHQQLYDYATSGNPGEIDSNHTTIKTYATDLDQATTDLNNTLSAIKEEWSGAASDNYYEQAQTVVKNMKGQVEDAQKTVTALGTAYSALAAARTGMPHPPSAAEQEFADLSQGPAKFAVLAAEPAAGGAVLAASQAAQDSINNSHQQAISTMETLAAAYQKAQGELPIVYTKKHDDSQGQSQTAPSQIPLNGGAGAVVPIFYPNPVGGMAVGTPASGRGSSSGKNAGVGAGSVGSLPGTSLQGAGATATAASGPIGAVQTPTGLAGGAAGAGAQASGLAGGLGTYGAAGLGSNVSSSGLFGEEEGGGYGTAGLGGAGGGGVGGVAGVGVGAGGGAGGAGFGEDDAAALGLTGPGSGLAGGADADAALVGASGSGDGFSAAAGADAAGAAGAPDAAGGGSGQTGAAGQGAEGMPGGMGGRGGSGGSGDEQRDDSQYIREDKEYWYGNAKYAPPGGLIE